MNCPKCGTKLRIIKTETTAHRIKLTGQPQDKDRKVISEDFQIVQRLKICGSCGYRTTEEIEERIQK